MYCTGSDASTSTEDNESSVGTSSTPQTVYNTSQYKIQHQHHKTGIPQHYSDERNNAQGESKLQHDLNYARNEGIVAVDNQRKLNRSLDQSADVLNNCLARAQNQALRKPDLGVLDPTGGGLLTLRKNLSGESFDNGSFLSSTYPSSVDRLSHVSAASSFSYASAYEHRSDDSSWKESTVSRQRMSSESSTKSAIYQPERKADSVRRSSHSDIDESLLQGSGLAEGCEQWWLQYLFSKFEDKGMHNHSVKIL